MKIVVNYLREVQELFEEGKIDFIDYFKLYSLNDDLSPLEWCLKNKGLFFHGIVGKASAFGDRDLVEKTDIEATREILQKSNAPYISGHLCVSRKEQTREETLSSIQKNIEDFRTIFGKEVVLENIPYRKYYEHCLYLIQPDVIAQIVYENDCNFLFDISHARKAALFLQMSFEEYVSKLPMDRVVEIHLAGMFTMPDGTQMDYHGIMNDEDYRFLEEAVEKYPTLQYITLEYGSYCPKEKLDLLKDWSLPLANYESVNPIVKEEAYEQLIRIKEILYASKNKRK